MLRYASLTLKHYGSFRPHGMPNVFRIHTGRVLERASGVLSQLLQTIAVVHLQPMLSSVTLPSRLSTRQLPELVKDVPGSAASSGETPRKRGRAGTQLYLLSKGQFEVLSSCEPKLKRQQPATSNVMIIERRLTSDDRH